MKAKVVKNVKQSTLIPNVLVNVKQGSAIYTDALASYSGLKLAYAHEIVDHHLFEYVRGKVHTNGMEKFWSLLKRSLKGTYVSVSAHQLEAYVDEQVTRFNERKGNDATRFNSTMGRVMGRRLTYRDLKGRNPDSLT